MYYFYMYFLNQNYLSMKNFFLITLFSLSFVFSANAQFDAENLFGGVNAAYANPIGDFSEFAKGGFSYNVVVGYRLTDNLGVGVEYGSALTAALDTTLTSGLFGIQLYGLNSYLAKGWYRFSTGSVRPYVGLGVGVARVAEPDVTVGTETVEGAKRMGLGGNIELGVNLKGFNISYGFNLSGKVAEEPIFVANAADLPVSYHRFALGYVYNF